MKRTLSAITGIALLCGGNLVFAQDQQGQQQQAQPNPQAPQMQQPGRTQLAQPQPRRPMGGQQGAMNAATNALPQQAGGSNRAPDRFDRTPLDRQLGQLGNTVGGGARGTQLPPATNQPQDFQAMGGQGGSGGGGGGSQSDSMGMGSIDGGFVGGSSSTGYGYGTAMAGSLFGTSEVIRSVGEANRNSATANVLQEKAVEQRIQNHYDSVVNYFKVREANRDLRSREGLPISSQEDRVRYSQARLPERLTDDQLNRDIGDIRWPAVLMAPEFAEHRQRLEELFYNRTYYNSGLASSSFPEIKAESERMLATLQNLVEVTEPESYLHARKFIEGLAYEARFVAGPGGLARS